MAKTVKSVGFNSRKPEEAAMLKAIRRRNFSGYVKKLIAADLKAREVAQAEPPESPEIQPRKKPARPPQAESSYSTQEHSPIPSQYIPPKPPTDPRNGPLINPKPRGY